MSGEQGPGERGFTIVDKRGGGEEPQAERAERAPEAPQPEHAALPPVDFTSFVLSLATAALHHLGLVAGPDGKAPAPDLRLARHTIDTLEMLATKTRGNLEPDETDLLDNALGELRMRFVEISRR